MTNNGYVTDNKIMKSTVYWYDKVNYNNNDNDHVFWLIIIRKRIITLMIITVMTVIMVNTVMIYDVEVVITAITEIIMTLKISLLVLLLVLWW